MTNNPLPNIAILRVEENTFLSGVRGATKSTIDAYNHDIDMYLEYLLSDQKISSEFDINDRTIRHFVTFLRGRGNSDSTIQRRLDGVNSFWKFLHLEYDFTSPKSATNCGIRLKNKRNPTPALPHSQYVHFMETIYDELRKIK